MRILLLPLLAVLPAGCQTTQAPPQEQWVYVRKDGRSVMTDPKLMQDGQLDMAICQGEAGTSVAALPIMPQPSMLGMALATSQRNHAMASIIVGCMARRGYLYVPRSQAQSIVEAARRRQ